MCDMLNKVSNGKCLLSSFFVGTDNKYLFLPTPFYAELDEWMK